MGAGRMPVVRIARNFLAHAPGLVRHGPKPARELATTPSLADRLAAQVYQAEVGMTELALEDPDEIIAAVRGVRNAQASPGSAG